ncbi:hypothetical protein SAMN04489859_102025 [Paracoccus alcaliphilus]|uniref:Uncharacterized protein n=1 Tax=Paracoccus alcaliphilus TaxID=34002 RepID=A0A1H8K2W2_9RHOB|nr:hypothetical protein [Paracoccus alcaliphilus]WCR17522.1 hypothetical protein JHW40_14460 [Paracoccus alcaliphilus]SEN87310.1 hypothetical protein SAMN04489859_102025 [Paracoccus alcaliphilus]
MSAPRILSLDARPVLDLQFRAFETVTRGIRVIGSWYMDPVSRQTEPCLVLLDANRPVRPGRTIPCIIPLSDMWKWTREMGDPAHVARVVHDWISSGALPGVPDDRSDAFRIFDAVQSRLRDLWSMPPLPPKAAIKHGAIPVGEIEITERESGKTVQEIEVVASNVRD